MSLVLNLSKSLKKKKEDKRKSTKPNEKSEKIEMKTKLLFFECWRFDSSISNSRTLVLYRSTSWTCSAMAKIKNKQYLAVKCSIPDRKSVYTFTADILKRGYPETLKSLLERFDFTLQMLWSRLPKKDLSS